MVCLVKVLRNLRFVYNGSQSGKKMLRTPAAYFFEH